MRQGCNPEKHWFLRFKFLTFHGKNTHSVNPLVACRRTGFIGSCWRMIRCKASASWTRPAGVELSGARAKKSWKITVPTSLPISRDIGSLWKSRPQQRVTKKTPKNRWRIWSYASSSSLPAKLARTASSPVSGSPKWPLNESIAEWQHQLWPVQLWIWMTSLPFHILYFQELRL